MPNAAGVEKENALRAAGFNDGEVEQWKSQTQNDLLNAGFTTSEIGDYFGAKDPDMKPLKAVFDKNMSEAALNPKPETSPKNADSFHDAIEAGWQMSVSGLIKRGKAPDVLLPEDAPMFYRIASQVSGLAGDLPAMWGGAAVAGAAAAPVAAAAGAATGGLAAPIVEGAAAGYGAFALPAAIRSVLMQHYEKGDVKDFSDFWERAAATFIDANKQGLVGAATGGVGATVGKVAVGLGAKAVVKTTAQLSSEVATMVTVGKAIEGEVPHPQDFIDAAILVGGLHGVMKATPKFRDAYAKGGVKPAEIAQQALTDPLVKQELLAESPRGEVPKAIAEANGINPNPEISSPASEGSGVTKDGAPVPPKVERTDSTQKILDQIGEQPDAKGEKYGFRGAYKDVVDKLDPINEAVKKLNADPASLTANENPYLLGRVANDYKAKTKYVFEKGTIDFKTLAKNGESFQEIIKPFAKDPESFDAYLASRRALEVEGRGLTSGFDVEAAKDVVKKGSKTYQDAADRLVQFQNRILQYVKDSGRISEDTYKAFIEANKAYVPFSRIIDETESGGGKSSNGSLKTFKGSEKQIQSPLVSILENTNSLLKFAEKNRAGVALVQLAEKTKDQSILEKVKSASKVINISEPEVAKFLKDHGIEGDPEAFTVFRREQKQALNDDEFAIYRNGKREVWKSTGEAPVGLSEAIKSLDGDGPAQNVVLKIASGFTAIKKIGITIMPDFIVKNLFRDQLTAGAFSKSGTKPFLDILPALGDLIKKNDNYYNWLKSGGAQGTFIDVNTRYLETKIFDLDKNTGFIDQTWNVLRKPVDYLQAAGMLAEHATRLAEFKRVTKGATEGSKIFEGGFAAREVTVDFSRVGAKISALNSITAFMNMGIQGMDRTVRAIKEDPKGVTAKAALLITTPSVLLWWANHDDERYKQLPRWQKDLYWIIPTDHWVDATEDQAGGIPDYLKRTKNGKIQINDGPIFRVPKPQELGILFGTIPERALEKYFTDNPDAFKDFGESVSQLVSPATVPDAVAPIREQWANKSLFTGNKIVSGPIENVLPAYQYNEYTTDSAKALGKMIRTLPAAVMGKSNEMVDLPVSSPAIIENYVRSWSGNLGMYALQLADVALQKSGVAPDPVKPTDTLSDIPFIKAFVVRYPSGSAQPIQDFYNDFAKHEKVSNTITHLAKTGDFKNLEKELNDPQVQDMLVKLKGINDSLRTQAQFARRIYKNPDLSSSDQRQILDGIYYGMIETARLGNDMMRTLDKVQKSEGAGQ